MRETHGCGNKGPHILRRKILNGVRIGTGKRILLIQLGKLATEIGGFSLLSEALCPGHQGQIGVGVGGFLVRIEGNVGLLGLLFLLSLLRTSVVELKEKKKGKNVNKISS